MKLLSNKSTLKGEISIPGSKSHTIRAVAVAALAEGTSCIRNPLISSDTLSAVDCYRSLGAEIDKSNPEIWVVTGTSGKIRNKNQLIDVGNSGTTLRMALASAALGTPEGSVTFTGDKQIQTRLLGALANSLNDLGAIVQSVKGNGCAPAIVRGQLKGGRTSIECFTSQYLSSLLMACPLAEGDTEIEVTLLNEPDYVKITIDWLDKQQIRYENNDFKSLFIPGGQHYTAFDEAICADFSSATFFLCAAALCGRDVLIRGLDFNDSQPDKAVADYLAAMGADIRQEPNGIRIRASALKGVEIDMNRTPDALPAMAVTAAFADGVTRLVNVPQARKKETDRIACMAVEMKKLGADIEELPDGLIIRGGKPLTAAAVRGHDDHRIVMALAMAGLAIHEPVEIDTAEAMNVTFPEYVTLMKKLGADLNTTK
ncbi:MAG: 3-phosphoshikimate 1-carboxyvinyltransferase [Phycisphaerae bacterium]|nr:3-phosphoshikimate 1-carboxyvinyltransferase [Phycisphaerae bacterium]